MKFILFKDIITQAGKPVTWLEAGEYPVSRMFDESRVLLSIGRIGTKQYTVVNIKLGQLINNG